VAFSLVGELNPRYASAPGLSATGAPTTSPVDACWRPRRCTFVDVFHPPSELTDAEVLESVRSGWLPAVDRVEHLAVGFGAHHWCGELAGAPLWFVTYDRFTDRHTAASLAAAYSGAVELAEQGLEFVVAPVRTRSGDLLVRVATGGLSCTPWVRGKVVGEGPLSDPGTAAENLTALRRLHSSTIPEQLPVWQPALAPDLGGRLESLVGHAWETGPYGEGARRAIADRLPDIRAWTDRLVQLARRSAQRRWVPTHGETHTRNQILTDKGIVFIDWESLKLAPPERDFSTLVQAGYGDQVEADPAMVELFDLEWRLSEIEAYSRWFAAAHAGTTDDRVAFQGLRDELGREPWWRP